MVACKKNDSAKMSENQNPVLNPTEFIYQGGSDPGACFDQPGPCLGASCAGFACCKIRNAQTQEEKYACRKPGNQPIPHFAFGAISNLTIAQANFVYIDIERIHEGDTTSLGNNLLNNLHSDSELLFLDDGLNSEWANDNVTYRFFLKNSSYSVNDTLVWSGTISN